MGRDVAPPAPQALTLWSVSSRERVFRLSAPLEVSVAAVGDTITCSNTALKLCGTGPNLGHEMAAFSQDFASRYACFVESEEPLSADGELLAQSLCALVKAEESTLTGR